MLALSSPVKIVVHIILRLWCFCHYWSLTVIESPTHLWWNCSERPCLEMWKYLLCLCFDDTITFGWTIPLRGLVKKYERLLLRILVCFFLSSQGHRALCFSKEQQVSLKPLKRSTQSFSAVRSASVITWKQLRSRCSLSPDKDTVRISWVIVGKLSERGGCC